MKKILVLNSGSSTVKYQLFLADGNSFSVLAKGVAERIGLSNSLISYSYDDSVKHTKSVDLPNHEVAIKEVLHILLSHSIKSLDEIAAVGHRMGHGGEYFDKSCTNPLHGSPALQHNLNTNHLCLVTTIK